MSDEGYLCPLQHGPLKARQTPEAGWFCDSCAKEVVIGSTLYGCDTCEFDLCLECYGDKDKVCFIPIQCYCPCPPCFVAALLAVRVIAVLTRCVFVPPAHAQICGRA